MGPFLFRITEENKHSLNKPHESNRIYYSELNKWDTGNAFRSFSLKYVLDGVINYQAGNERYEVNGGSFLVANKRDEVTAYFQSEKLTRSICIDISTDIVSEAATVMAARENFDFENYLDRYFIDGVVCANIYAAAGNPLGEKLVELARQLRSVDEPGISKEWFLEITELIILQEKGNYLALNGIRSVKHSTRVETLARLSRGRAYMDEQCLQNPEMTEVAKVSNMSAFHFFRSFKQAYGITPYRYLLNNRLEYSKSLLREKLPVKEIAITCGFADIFSYSKAFRKAFGTSPTGFQKMTG